MSKFVRNISLFIAGLPLLATKGIASTPESAISLEPAMEPEAVPLRPLNWETDNLFAGHRSHYSGSGGGSSYRAPAYVAPAPAPVPPKYLYEGSSNHSGSSSSSGSAGSLNQLTNPSGTKKSIHDSSVANKNTGTERPDLTNAEKLKLQIMRVQIKLMGLGLYDGAIDGVLNEKTQQALRYFQDLKGLPKTGTMSTATLNAMGIPAVN